MAKPAKVNPETRFIDNSGDSEKNAIVITLDDHYATVMLENEYLLAKYGPNYKKVGQALLQEGDEYCDWIQIILPDGTRKSVFFNISKAMLKMRVETEKRLAKGEL